jgi:formyl-CoA transferase
VPSGPINTAADICADAQYQSRNMIQDFAVDTGNGDPTIVGFPGIVPVLGERSVPIRSVGPDLGEHTHEVLSSLLGMSDDQIDRASATTTAPTGVPA